MASHDKEKYEEFRRKVWERDYGIFVKNRKLSRKDEWRIVCVFWKCLTNEEKQLFLETWKDQLWKCNIIDVAHFLPRSTHPKHKYDPDNAALINTIAHGCLDTYKDPLTGKPMKREDKCKLMERIRIQMLKGRNSN